MVLVTSKTSAGRAAVVPGSAKCGGGEEDMAGRLFQALGARHRNSGPTRPEGNRTTRRTLLASVASTPEAVAGRRACAWHQLAGWCHVAFLGSDQLMTSLTGARPRCAGASSLRFLRRPRWPVPPRGPT